VKNDLLNKAYTAAEAIDPYLIVKPGLAGNEVVKATAPTDPLIGAINILGGQPGMTCEVARVGVSEVQLGGTVAAGDPITSDVNGQGVLAVAGDRIIGFAETAGPAGAVIPYIIAPGQL